MSESASTSTPTPAPAVESLPPSTADGKEELNEDGTPLSDNQKKKRAKKAEAERVKAEKAAKLAADKKTKEESERVSPLFLIVLADEMGENDRGRGSRRTAAAF